ncbi:hypothetical protein SLA2020_044780 [Shorea laevis]
MLSTGLQQGNLKRATICRGGPKLSHLFFADDSLLFGVANEGETVKLVSILQQYGAISGQQINLNKSSIFFSCNTSRDVQSKVMKILNISQIISNDKYLGMPLLIGRSKSICFGSIRDRIWTKIKGWKNKLLSRAGREVLLKAVVQAIPTYCMGCFHLPQNFLRSLNSILSNYWWGDNSDKRKIHWLRWDLVCRPKALSGLGFCDFQAFNLAMLAKQCWRLMQDPTSLCYQVLQAKYFKNGDLLGATLGTNPSMVWRGVIAGLGILKQGSCWRIGDGSSVRLWRDPWVPESGVLSSTICDRNLEWDARVSSLIDQIAWKWDPIKLQLLFPNDTIEKISSIPLSKNCAQDRLIWRHTTDGRFTVKSAYRLGRSLWLKLW